MKRVFVFDLDDTLYDEKQFVYGGFKAVAAFLSPLLSLSRETVLRRLKQEVQQSRDQVFDRLLQKQGIYSKKLVKECLRLYRSHPPRLKLTPAAKKCLNRLKSYPLYVVTDGNKQVQKRKFEALGLTNLIKRCLCTHAFGLRHQKPSPYCFQLICRLEKVRPAQVTYVADNPHKDFITLKKLGFNTIRLLTGPYRDLRLASTYEAAHHIHSLNEL